MAPSASEISPDLPLTKRLQSTKPLQVMGENHMVTRSASSERRVAAAKDDVTKKGGQLGT